MLRFTRVNTEIWSSMSSFLFLWHCLFVWGFYFGGGGGVVLGCFGVFIFKQTGRTHNTKKLMNLTSKEIVTPYLDPNDNGTRNVPV